MFECDRRLFRLLFVAAVFPIVGGCGDGMPQTYPVSGKVLVDGKSIARGTVTFRPDAAKGNTYGFEPIGEVGEDGTYHLMTISKKGAPPGWYKVTVLYDKPTKSMYEVAVSLLPAKYKSAETTPLSVEVVKEAVPNAYDLRLSSQ